jgi:hypothetical protein
VAGAVTQPYSHVSQYISELGAIGAPYANLVNLAGFLTIGLATAVFACATYAALGTTAVHRAGAICLLGISLGYLLAAFAPCDPGCPAVGSSRQAVHNVGGDRSDLAAAGADRFERAVATYCRERHLRQHCGHLTHLARNLASRNLTSIMPRRGPPES